MAFDWKFLVIMLATIAGVLVPVWLWQGDLSARSLSVRLVSSVALQPAGTTSIPDLIVSIDGVKIQSPFLSTLELSNDGSKPIPASDFESPIELSAGQNTKVVRARISFAEPKDVKAELVTSSESIKVRPLLLNSMDTLTIVVITSGGPPIFIPRARIAGISKIKYEDTTTKRSNWYAAISLAVIALLAIVLYFVYGAVLLKPNALRLGRVLSASTMLACVLLSELAISRSYKAVGTEFDLANGWPIPVAGLLVGTIVYFYLVRKARRQSVPKAG